MVEDKPYRLSDIADALGIPLTRVRTMRARGHTGMWDSGVDESADDFGRGWRTYSFTDAVAFACVLELIERGVAADVAGSVIGNCRGWLAGHHADAPALADTWIGVVHLNGSAGHVGGHLAQVLASVEQQVGRDIRDTKGGGGSAVFLVNASNHARRVREALASAD
ncbi:protein of unknown function [Candidatus Filomicrobium marinum]|uniref:Uncharacterized protein n=1 Tax=Candidatus Filomicrobium marinum TaxID=1608628 RepID=A0A0D6JIS9_9HYPH|nr:hypothetical protein [Candidatus Filomicrobium marinum]CFX34594.1 protein of unknown function [Candidatus Filomicrobium marinum]CPR21851.1 protein of unknown function [Candidatus Filomicrobium marinum]